MAQRSIPPTSRLTTIGASVQRSPFFTHLLPVTSSRLLARVITSSPTATCCPSAMANPASATVPAATRSALARRFRFPAFRVHRCHPVGGQSRRHRRPRDRSQKRRSWVPPRPRRDHLSEQRRGLGSHHHIVSDPDKCRQAMVDTASSLPLNAGPQRPSNALAVRPIAPGRGRTLSSYAHEKDFFGGIFRISSPRTRARSA